MVLVRGRKGGNMSIVDSKRKINRDALAAYIEQTKSRSVLLSKEEEFELAREYLRTRDPAIREMLVRANLRLVVKIAHEHLFGQYERLLDLIQEGNLGLLRGIERFDPERGMKLSSYAAWWIRAYILKHIIENARMVKIGTTAAQRRLFYSLGREKRRLERMGISPDAKKIAERLGVRVRDVEQMEQRLGSSDASLDAPRLVGDEDERTLYSSIASAADLVDEVFEHEEMLAILRRELPRFKQGLDSREVAIVEQRWEKEAPDTLDVLGKQLGVSRERVRQLEEKIKAKIRRHLRHYMNEEDKEDDLESE